LKKSKGVLPVIQVIYGRRGLGKTKRMIDMANSALSQAKGDIVFVDDDNRCILDLKHNIRYINAGEFKVTTPCLFAGFVCGILAQDYDIEQIFLDGFPELVGLNNIEDLKSIFAQLEEISKRQEIVITLSVSGDPENVPEFIKQYVIA
jgi:hypothetical protein